MKDYIFDKIDAIKLTENRWNLKNKSAIFFTIIEKVVDIVFLSNERIVGKKK